MLLAFRPHRLFCVARAMSTQTMASLPTAERAAELAESLAKIRSKVPEPATLIAVSKLKPAADILACYENGQRDFGENYVQELVEKAPQLPDDIRWHFIGTLQSNKAKVLAVIPNLHAIQTVGSAKAAQALNRALPEDRTTPLNVLLQVNTSGEESKSGLPPLSSSSSSTELVDLAKLIISECPKLNLQGLMTIGALGESLAERDENKDFDCLKETRGLLSKALDGKHLMLSMGMSGDFEAALKAGSGIVRVGTGIFGARPKKD